MKNEPPALSWPRYLELPPENVILIYLDLNHWISLAQASVGHEKGIAFLDILEACRRARTAGNAIFVLSAVHYMEMNKIKDPTQRWTVAAVMEELTGFASLISRVLVMELELATVLDGFVRTPVIRPTVSLLGRGVRHSLGQRSGVRITGPTGDATVEVRERMGREKFDSFVEKAELLLDRGVLRGPANDEVNDLRVLGWKPEAASRVAEERAVQERNQSATLDSDKRWRHGRLRDIISARELMIEFQNMLPRSLAERNLSLTDVMTDPQSARSFVRAMPSTEVSIELKTAWHRNTDKTWTGNDIFDLDALALAVPYCDVVLTDKACHHALTVARLGERMHTALPRKLEDLPHVLETWKPIRHRPESN
jgi:hypothetical protein